MPLDLPTLIDPTRTAVVTQEIQRGILEGSSALPALAEGATRVGLLGNVARLLNAARSAGARVVHCTAERRADGRGDNVENKSCGRANPVYFRASHQLDRPRRFAHCATNR